MNVASSYPVAVEHVDLGEMVQRWAKKDYQAIEIDNKPDVKFVTFKIIYLYMKQFSRPMDIIDEKSEDNGKSILFRTIINNNSPTPQNINFSTTETVSSLFDVHLSRSVSKEKEFKLQLSFKFGELGGSSKKIITVNKTAGETISYSQTFNITSSINVQSKSKLKAEMFLHHQRISGSFKLYTEFSGEVFGEVYLGKKLLTVLKTKIRDLIKDDEWSSEFTIKDKVATFCTEGEYSASHSFQQHMEIKEITDNPSVEC